MRLVATLMLVATALTTAMGQNSPSVLSNIVISEIMYNPPETGTDTLEFIELYNRGDQTIDLQGYTFTAGIVYTFPNSYPLAPGAYVMVASDSAAFQRNFNKPAFRFVSGGLSNSGERLELQDGQGNIIDSLRYDEIAPWPTAANAGGSSLVLCDVDSDNALAANWAAANTSSGFSVNGVAVFANPGAASQCATGPVVGFVATSFEVNEAQGAIAVQVAFSGGGLETYTVNVEATALGNATPGVDFDIEPSQLTFPVGVIVDTQVVQIFIINDALPEVLETAVVQLNNPSSGLTVDGPRANFEMDIVDDDTQIPNIVITEIFYNAPGADEPYEYMELYNADDAPVSLNGFYFTQGIEDTIPNITLMAGAYLIVAKDSASFINTFGPALTTQWASGGSLNNSGEDIELRDPAGNVVDYVDYRPTAPWPTGANGGGTSLVLCDPAADNNDAANWADATQPSGAVVNGTAVFASPGEANDCSPAPPVTYPAYTIGQLTGVNSQGVADSAGVRAQLDAIVYGVNMRPAGLQFTLIDSNNDGIAIFSNSLSFGYTVQEGDRVIARGVVAQFNGLTQLNLDTVYRVSAGNNLFDPTVISALDEAAESQLVKLLNVTLVDPAQWTNTGTGFNVDVADLNGNTYAVRIDSDVDLFGTPAPQGRFNVTGLGGQFDATQPYTEGYQLLPRYQDDIELITSVQEPAWAAGINIFPNPAGQYAMVQLPVNCTQVQLINAMGQVCLQGAPQQANFRLALDNLPAGVYTVALRSGAEWAYRRLVKAQE